MEEYFAAKMRLFDTLAAAGPDGGDRRRQRCRGARRRAFCAARGLTIFTVGAKGEAIALKEARPHALATSLQLGFEGAEL